MLTENCQRWCWCHLFWKVVPDIRVSNCEDPAAECTQSTKKLYPCIRCHNSGKQCRILTKFYGNTETLNCKQVTKFQQNRSTSATATASLVRSLKSISAHYRHRRDWLSSVRPCEWQDVSTPKVCVQNVHRVLERKLKDVVATAWPLHRWRPSCLLYTSDAADE